MHYQSLGRGFSLILRELSLGGFGSQWPLYRSRVFVRSPVTSWLKLAEAEDVPTALSPSGPQKPIIRPRSLFLLCSMPPVLWAVLRTARALI